MKFILCGCDYVPLTDIQTILFKSHDIDIKVMKTTEAVNTRHEDMDNINIIYIAIKPAELWETIKTDSVISEDERHIFDDIIYEFNRFEDKANKTFYFNDIEKLSNLSNMIWEYIRNTNGEDNEIE